MLFSSVTFLFFFLPVVLVLYYIIPAKGKNIVLLIASLVFYAWGEPVYLALMLFTIALNYLGGLLIDRYRSRAKRAKRLLALTVVLNLALLGFFVH